MKLKAKKKKGTNIFGLKGVSHSIKKPTKLISHPKLKVSKSSSAKEKTFSQIFRESLEEERKMKKKSQKKKNTSYNKRSVSPDVDGENQIEPRNMTPKRSGNIALNTSRNVSFEIKNGQPVFRLRRSPRKSLQNAYLEATHGKSSSKSDKVTSKILQTPEKLNESS